MVTTECDGFWPHPGFGCRAGIGGNRKRVGEVFIRDAGNSILAR